MSNPTATQIIDTAAREIGNYYPGVSKYGQWYGDKFSNAIFDKAAFCAMGLSWVFAQHSGGLDIFPLHAYTPSGAQWFRTRGAWFVGIEGVKRGDIVFFDFPGAPSRISHEGIVESVNSDGSVNAIEFNTSGTAGGDQRNGRVVARKRRKSYIVGYGRPSYGAGSTPVAVKDTRPRNRDGSLRLSVDGELGPATISRWQEVMDTPIDGVISTPSTLIKRDQQYLNAVVTSNHMRNLTGRDKLVVDGSNGPNTIQARQFMLRNFMNPIHQKNLIGHLLDFDGSMGPETIRVLQFALNNASSRTRQYGRV